MLVLSRFIDEVITIETSDGLIEVMIVDVRDQWGGQETARKKVRVGIKAPQSVKVHRKEVYNAIQREKQQ